MLNTDRLCPGCMNDGGGEKICPVCGYDRTEKNPEDCLPVGFTVGDRYLIGQAKKRNGEGIVYIAWDSAENAAVRIKEYFPAGFSLRNPDKTVSIVKGGEYTFNEGLIEFLDINRQIIASELPSLMPFFSVFEENGTVYAVMKNISCITMGEFLKKNGGSLKWEQARALFLPLIDTVKGMNDQGIVHGGISSSTVLVGRDGKLRLSGYGIKKLRRKNSEIEPEFMSGFAAIEQYVTDKMSIGSYTDVYGLSVLFFNVLVGTVPPDATERIKNDSMTIPARFAEELPRHVLSALANGLQVLPQNRTENVEIFKNELVYGETNEDRAHRDDAQRTGTAKPKAEKKGSTAKYVVISSVCTAAVFIAVVAVLVFTVFRNDIFGTASQLTSASSSEAPSVASIGSVDANAAESAVLYTVPKLTGKYYSELIDNEEYDKFEFSIKDKVFNDKIPKGQICAQSLAEGTSVARDTKIELTISLGPKEIKIANVIGLDEDKAIIELLKQGFLYGNIEVLEKYDEDHTPGTVLEQEPKYGTQVSTDIPVKIYINSYTGSDSSSSSSRSSR